MKRHTISMVVLSAAIALGGCAQNRPHEDAGILIGGVLGGLLGNQVGKGSGRTAAIIIGTLAGAAIGGSVGRSMDDTDRMKTAQTLETVRTGVPASWRNPDTGNHYEVIPTRTYENDAGPCREYTVNASVGGKQEKVYGTACRQADGRWKMSGE